MILVRRQSCASYKTSRDVRDKFPDRYVATASHAYRFAAYLVLAAPARGNDSLHGYSTVAGGDGKRATQGQDPLPHSNQAEAKLVVRAQSAAIVAHPYPSAAAAVAPCPGKRPGGFDGHADGCRAGVAKHVCQGFLNGTVNRQIGRFSGLAERRRNRGFDGHTRMRLTPQAQESIERLAKAKLRQSNRPQLFKNPPIELLQGIDLFQYGAAMLSQRIRVRFAGVGNPHQGTGVGAQREKIGSELIVQFPRDLLALDVLQCDDALRQPSLVVDGVSQCGREMVQLGT